MYRGCTASRRDPPAVLLIRGDCFGDFSFADTDNHTAAMLSYLKQCGYLDAVESDTLGHSLIAQLREHSTAGI